MPGPFDIPPFLTAPATGITNAQISANGNASFDYVVKFAIANSAVDNANDNGDLCEDEFIAETIDNGIYLSNNTNSLENFWNIINNSAHPEHLTKGKLLQGISKTYFASNKNVIATLLKLTSTTTAAGVTAGVTAADNVVPIVPETTDEVPKLDGDVDVLTGLVPEPGAITH